MPEKSYAAYPTDNIAFIVDCIHVTYKLQLVMEIKQTETFRKWEQKLCDKKAKAVIAARLFRLANGLFGDVSAVGEGVSELRIHYGPGYRIYFQQRKDEIIVLLCGGDKGSQTRDITIAKKLANELER